MSEELLKQAVVIRDESTKEANTAARIGRLFVDVINKIGKSLNADAVTFEGSPASFNMVFSYEGGSILIPVPVVSEQAAGVITPALINQILQSAYDKVDAEATARDNADKELQTLIDENGKGISAIRGESTLSVAGTQTSLSITMNIGKGGLKSAAIPVHGGEDGYTAADTPALIEPFLFQELSPLPEALAEEVKNRQAADTVLSESINSLLKSVAKLTCSISPSVVFRSAAEPVEVTVSAAMTTVVPKKMTLLMGNDEVTSQDEVAEISAPVSATPTANIQFTAKAETSNGLLFEAKATLQVVDPVYAGAGQAYADIILDENKQAIRTSASGTYQVKVANDGDYVWFLVPRNFAVVRKATLSGFDFPLETATQVYVGGSSALSGGIAYSAYRSSNRYAAGTLTIVLS